MIVTNEQMTPREHLEHEWYAEEARLTREYGLNMKRLELEEMKLEAKWNTWLKIPITIIKLPVYTILALGIIVAYVRKHEPSENFWKLLNGQHIAKDTNAKANTDTPKNVNPTN